MITSDDISRAIKQIHENSEQAFQRAIHKRRLEFIVFVVSVIVFISAVILLAGKN